MGAASGSGVSVYRVFPNDAVEFMSHFATSQRVTDRIANVLAITSGKADAYFIIR